MTSKSIRIEYAVDDLPPDVRAAVAAANGKPVAIIVPPHQCEMRTTTIDGNSVSQCWICGTREKAKR